MKIEFFIKNILQSRYLLYIYIICAYHCFLLSCEIFQYVRSGVIVQKQRDFLYGMTMLIVLSSPWEQFGIGQFVLISLLVIRFAIHLFNKFKKQDCNG